MAVKRSPRKSDEIELNSSAAVVLGLLSFGQAQTGYELRQLGAEVLKFFWTVPAMSQVYRDLERLESLGLVDSIDDAQGDRPRTAYRINQAGTAALATWLNDGPLEPPSIRLPVALRVLFGHAMDRQRLLAQLEAHRDWLNETIEQLATLEQSLAVDPSLELQHRLAQWGQALHRGDRRGLDSVVAHLRDKSPS
jgi:DNA-binding PadR family transcriptional regulator